MKVQVVTGGALERKADVLVLGVFQSQTKAEEAQSGSKSSRRGGRAAAASKVASGADWLRAQFIELDDQFAGELSALAVREGFRADAGQFFSTHGQGKIPAGRVLLLGLGAVGDAKLDTLRRLGGRALGFANQVKAKRVTIIVPEIESLHVEALTGACAEGVHLAHYRFDRHLTQNKESGSVEEVELVRAGSSRASSKATLARAEAIAEGVKLARDLVNECPSELTPLQFAKEAQRVGKIAQLQVKVLAEAELKKERMGMMLAVARAASPYTPPCLVRLHYKPAGKAKKRIALVGKGLTFDSGGLDIKPAAGMLDMKVDMSGAAAVLGAMLAIGKLKPAVEVIGYLGCVENGIGGNAYHPGDVLKSRKGLTVEVNNTDAEGRLVLGDCIDYALTTDKPDVLIDLATLTGACMVALGPTTAGLFSDDDALAEDIAAAGQRAGESFWRLPLNDELAGQLKSQIADMRNTGERFGGAITAALFLKRFVDGRARWAHLDIAGPATMERDHDYTPRGGAGFGVRTLVGVVDPA